MKTDYMAFRSRKIGILDSGPHLHFHDVASRAFNEGQHVGGFGLCQLERRQALL